MGVDRKIPITAVIFSLNEEKNIEDCVGTLVDFEEIVVVDSGSSDATLAICSRLNVRVVHFKWDGKYPKKRQWTLDNVSFRTKYILFIDADERCGENLAQELKQLVTQKSNEFSAAKVKLDYYFSNRQLRHGHVMWKTALMDPKKVNFAPVDDLQAKGMGELEGHYQPAVIGKTLKLKNRLTHNDNDYLDSWVERHVRYANWEAHFINRPNLRHEILERKSRGQFALRIPILQGFGYFIYSYFLKMGFLDGRAGFNFAFGKSWYYWLISEIAREQRNRAQ